jgi:CRISPR-associated protein Cmr6
MSFIPMPEYIATIDKKRANYALQFNKWTNIEGSFDSPRELKEKKADEFARLKKEYDDKKSILQEMADARYERTIGLLRTLRTKGFLAGILICKVSDALVCGIGDEHPLENSLRLDHCTGLPFVPSSSVKGVAKFAAEYDTVSDIPIHDKEKCIFGTQDCRGAVQFWDGFPAKVPSLKIDIMNNHFPDYYADQSGRTAPSDDMNPNPVFFMVVDSGSEFYFPVIAKDESDLRRAIEFLQQALSEWGVGAKTSVGYGMFYVFTIESIQPAAQAQVQELTPACQTAFERLRLKASPDNFVQFIECLTTEDEDWLRTQDLFAVPNFNKGFADKLVENTSIPAAIRKILAQAFLDHTNLKEAQKRATKGDKRDLDRYEKLQAIVAEKEPL